MLDPTAASRGGRLKVTGGRVPGGRQPSGGGPGGSSLAGLIGDVGGFPRKLLGSLQKAPLKGI